MSSGKRRILIIGDAGLGMSANLMASLLAKETALVLPIVSEPKFLSVDTNTNIPQPIDSSLFETDTLIEKTKQRIINSLGVQPALVDSPPIDLLGTYKRD